MKGIKIEVQKLRGSPISGDRKRAQISRHGSTQFAEKGNLENLAFEFGVSIRTIYSDIDALTPYYPIKTQSGKGGGVYVEDGFR